MENQEYISDFWNYFSKSLGGVILYWTEFLFKLYTFEYVTCFYFVYMKLINLIFFLKIELKV